MGYNPSRCPFWFSDAKLKKVYKLLIRMSNYIIYFFFAEIQSKVTPYFYVSQFIQQGLV